MSKINILIFVAAIIFFQQTIPSSAAQYDSDTLGTGADQLVITFIGHGTLMFEYGGKIIHVDPTLRESDYENLPAADLVLITHEHGDHLDPAAIEKIKRADTDIVTNKTSEVSFDHAAKMLNGESETFKGFKIEAVPAYNIISKRDDGQPYHPRGNGNGYVITFGSRRVYVAGDTEYIPEMNDMGKIDIAFLPMNLPYTMTIEMAAEAAKAINPTIFYPYHYGNSEVSRLAAILDGNQGIELRIRNMK